MWNLFYLPDERGLTAILIAVEAQCVGDVGRLLPLNCNCDITADNNEQRTANSGVLANNEEIILIWPRGLMGRIMRAEPCPRLLSCAEATISSGFC